MKASLAVVVVASVLAFFLGVAVTYGVMSWSYRIPNVATVKAVGVAVYQDAGLKVPVASIGWGVVEPGANKNYSCYVVNRSNVPVTLSLFTENWTPAEASNFITLSWDYDESVLSVDGVVHVTFTLHVDLAIENITSFSFDIVVVGSG